MLIILGGFLITWTPYAFVLLYNSFKNISDEKYLILSTISAVFAKTSVVLSTLFYIFTNNSIKSKFVGKKSRNNTISNPQYNRCALSSKTDSERTILLKRNKNFQ